MPCHSLITFSVIMACSNQYQLSYKFPFHTITCVSAKSVTPHASLKTTWKCQYLSQRSGSLFHETEGWIMQSHSTLFFKLPSGNASTTVRLTISLYSQRPSLYFYSFSFDRSSDGKHNHFIQLVSLEMSTLIVLAIFNFFKIYFFQNDCQYLIAHC